MSSSLDTASTISSNFDKYGVFISFRGEETCKCFTSYLYKASREMKIKADMDEVEEISPGLLRAIQESTISLIIFSKNYASSTWCLDELMHIIKYRKEKEQIVIPIFYDVDPSDVRNQKGSYAHAFATHEQRFPDETEKLHEWRVALEKAGGLSGWDSRHRYWARDIMSSSLDTASTFCSNFCMYDVFISFRGEDTRKGFMSYLYKALREKKVKTYIDEQTLKKGEEISPGLLKAIQESKISLIIFSQNYASSTWCLEELVHILKCREEKKQIVIPIFYNIDPSDVRNQKGSYAHAFAAHEQRFKDGTEKLHEWRVALDKAGSLSGWDSRHRYEPKLIKRIVESVLSTLNYTTPRTTGFDFTNLVGVDRPLEAISSLLFRSSDVRMIGLWGMGGIGKSTLARLAFHKLSFQFEGSCFLENIKEESERHGLAYLESKLFSELLEEEDIDVVNHFVRCRIQQQKVLIVLDDVNDREQLERLAGDRTWFGSGSRIIITTRDKHLLLGCADMIYEARQLNFDEALQLFLLNAFGGGRSCNEYYVELARSMAAYSGGHPLLLKALGSFLRAGAMTKWESTLDKLKSISPGSFLQTLRLCFEGLDDVEKDILLHIAFLKGKNKDLIERKLEKSGNLSGRKGIQALAEKNFIGIKRDGEVWMHDLVQEMAWDILRQESTKEPEKNCWSLIIQAVYHVWRTNKEIGAIEGRYFDVSKIEYEELQPTLKMLGKRYDPPKYFPSTINQHNLVGVDLPSSQLKQFWSEIEDSSSNVRLLISYQGQWSNIQGRWSFDGVKAKGIIVSRDITYHKLVEKLCCSLMVDRSLYDLDMRFLVNSAVPLPPFEIENDEDINFFLSENSGKDNPRYPLCISLVRRDIGQHVSVGN